MSEENKVLENNTDILHKISKEEYKDEWFIDKAILCYKAQNEKVFTFFRDNSQKDWLKKYNWCQRPDNTTMSLKRFDHIGNVHGHMSESLAEHYGLEQIDLNTFMHEFVAKLVEELNNIKEIEKSHKEENGKLRVEFEKVYEDNLTLANELEQEKEKNKELEEKLKISVAMLTKGTYPEKNEGDNDFNKKFIAVDKIMELLENEIIDISGFRCIAVEDIENLLEGN